MVGIPLMAFIAGGSYFLSIFMTTHMEVKDKQGNTSAGSQRTFDLEEERRHILKKLDIDSFSLSRIPRPDEEAAVVGNERSKGKSKGDINKQ